MKIRLSEKLYSKFMNYCIINVNLNHQCIGYKYLSSTLTLGSCYSLIPGGEY